MSTIGELSRRLQSRRPIVEPFLSQLFVQHGSKLVVGDEKDSDSRAEVNDGVNKVDSKASEACDLPGANSESSREAENKGKGKKGKKQKRGKGSRKK